MADPVASTVVSTLKEALAASPGVREMLIDGMRVVVSPDALEYWERRAAAEESPTTRPIASTIKTNHGD